MLKKPFTIILCILLIFGTALPAFAFEPTGFDVNAKYALLMSMDTNEKIYAKNENERVYPASITKIMTVILMLESKDYNPEAKIAMNNEAIEILLGTGSAVSGLKAGEEITQLDLVYFVLMASYGDCANLIALNYGGSIDNFVKMMNDKAKLLGMTGTHYANPVGLHDPENYTTPTDTYKLASYALNNSTFKEVCSSSRYTVPATNMSNARTLSTTNYLQDTATNYYYLYAKGVKTGFTDEAGRCLVSTASYGGYNYMCLVFGCKAGDSVRHEFVDSKNLYRWAFNTFRFKEIANAENPVDEMPVEISSATDFVPLYFQKSFISVLPKDADDSTIKIDVKLNSKSVDAPIKKGQVLGSADIIYAEQVIGNVNLVAGESIKRSTMLYLVRGIKRFFTSAYMKIFYVFAAIIFIFFIYKIIKLNAGRSKKRRVKYIPYNSEKDEKK